MSKGGTLPGNTNHSGVDQTRPQPRFEALSRFWTVSRFGLPVCSGLQRRDGGLERHADLRQDHILAAEWEGGGRWRAGVQGPLAVEEERLYRLRQELEGEARQELEKTRSELESQSRETQAGKLCATPFGVDVVGITEAVALTGALVGGMPSPLRFLGACVPPPPPSTSFLPPLSLLSIPPPPLFSLSAPEFSRLAPPSLRRLSGRSPHFSLKWGGDMVPDVAEGYCTCL